MPRGWRSNGLDRTSNGDPFMAANVKELCGVYLNSDRLSALSPEGVLVLPSSCFPAEGDLGSSILWDCGL